LKTCLFTPFQSEKGHSKSVLALFLLINLIVLFNVIFHSPWVGYDAMEHIEYIEILSDLRFPTMAENGEYFSPPLPYVLPAMLLATGKFSLEFTLKIGQFSNFLLSIGLTFYLLKICDLIRPREAVFKSAVLIFLGISPVYYKSFAFIRGEPQIAFLAVLILYETMIVFYKGNANIKHILTLGILMGLCALARQWGFFLFPAVGLFVFILGLREKHLVLFIKQLALVFLIAFLICSWFYIHLWVDYGSFTAFNRKPSEAFSLANQPPEFYFGRGWGMLFKTPFREVFLNQMFPTLFADFWGDYWAYFNVYGKNLENDAFIGGRLLLHHLKKTAPSWLETNLPEILPYLGHVNLVSVIPSLIFVGGVLVNLFYLFQFIRSKTVKIDVVIFSLSGLILFVSIAGYLWFLIQYPKPTKGDTIKATYMLQAVPFLALAAGELMYKIYRSARIAYSGILILLAVVFFHNFPVLISNYVYWDQFPSPLLDIFMKY